MNKSCARHKFRDHTMKKFYFFSIMALLICGITFTANAQDGGGKSKPAKAPKATPTQQTNPNQQSQSGKQGKNDKQHNFDQQSQSTPQIANARAALLLDEYEECIENMVALYNQNKLSNSSKIREYMSKANNLKKALNDLVDKMNQEQKERFGKLNTRLDRFNSRGKR